MIFSNIAILKEDGSIDEGKFLYVKDGRIAFIGDAPPPGASGRSYDGKGKLLMPGFYNAHAHSPMTLLRGYGENLALQDWLNTRIFPFEALLDSNAVYWGTMLAMAESMRFGIVSSTDMYNFGDDMVMAALDSGMKTNIGRAVLCFTDEDIYGLESYKECVNLFSEYHEAGEGRVKIDMSIHAEYTSTPKVVKQLADYTNEIGAAMHVHVSETSEEHTACKQRHGGMTPVEYFSSLGLFDTRTTAAHCVWVEESDMEILAEKGVTVASCPVSNMKLSSGACNVPLLLEKGVNVAMGTDGTASNNNLNFIEEMKFFALVNKLSRGNPTLVSPYDAIHAATAAGAKSQGRDDCGLIREGYKADLIVLDISHPNMHPVHDLLNNIVYAASGSDIALTMVDGRILYEEGEYKTLDIEKVVFECEKATKKILGALS
ncbi:MAG: amidohydrolase [Clostridiales Family XIII bacterium]|jgi:5-methylthioadenosine/S-adenosylhomocysteine deaminase|nr:amidohydrolase [Clostridiales Family XIII bacterium]